MAEKRPRDDSGMAASDDLAPAAAAAGGQAAAAAAGSTSAATFAAASDASSFSQASLDGVLAVIRRLRVEAGGNENFVEALSTIRKMLSNILHHPTDEKFRSVRIANKQFYARVGRFQAGVELLQCFGFEEAVRSTADESASAAAAATSAADGAVGGDAVAATHLALPIADPAKMAPGLVLLEAARQASTMVAGVGDGDPSSGGASAASAASASTIHGNDTTTDERVAKRVRSQHSASDVASITHGAPMADAAACLAAGAGGAGEEGDGDDSFMLPPDLEDYSAAGIDQYFGTVLSRCGLSVGGLLMQQLVATAEDASSIAQATADAAALSRAQYWLQILRDFQAADASGSTGDGSSGSNGTAGATPAEPVAVGGASGGEDAGNPEGSDIGWDGNDDACASCGGEGELVCCDSCPRAYHMTTECLGGPNALPPDDDDAQWFCPACAMETRLATATW